MKQLFALAAVVAALSSTQAIAQAKNFEGFSLGANIDADRSTVEATGTGAISDSGNSTGLGLQAQYSWALGSNFLLGLGVTANTGNRKAGAYSNGNEAYVKDRYSIDLIPSIAVNDKVLVFAKISSVGANGTSSSGTGTASIQGLGYGLGFRALIDKNLFWQAAYDYVKFTDVTFSNGTVSSFKGNILSLGIGYKF